MDSTQQYSSMQGWSQGQRGNADVLIMVGDWKGQKVDGWGGVAWVSSVCSLPKNAYSMNLWSYSPASTSYFSGWLSFSASSTFS